MPKTYQDLIEAFNQQSKKNHSLKDMSYTEAQLSHASSPFIKYISNIVFSDRMIFQYFQEPLEKCEAATARVITALKRKGILTNVRGIAMFTNPGDFMPTNHFIAIAHTANKKVAIDVTAGQFLKPQQPHSIISLEKEWENTFSNLMPTKTAVVYKDYPCLSGAKRDFGPFALLGEEAPAIYKEGFGMLKTPKWAEDIRKYPQYGKILTEINKIKFSPNYTPRKDNHTLKKLQRKLNSLPAIQLPPDYSRNQREELRKFSWFCYGSRTEK